MYRSINQLRHYKTLTTDNESCAIEDVFFNQKSWDIHYIVIETGSWLMDREILLHPDIVKEVIDKDKKLVLPMTKEKVVESPAVNSVLPIAQEAELLLAKYWEWVPKDTPGPLPYEAGDTIEAETDTETKAFSEDAAKSKLRSWKEVEGYTIHAVDSKFGHIEDLLFDDNWRICYAVVDTRNWIPGKKVLLPVREIEKIRWSEHALHVDATSELVKTAPFYEPSTGVTAEDEEAVRKHFKEI